MLADEAKGRTLLPSTKTSSAEIDWFNMGEGFDDSYCQMLTSPPTVPPTPPAVSTPPTPPAEEVGGVMLYAPDVDDAPDDNVDADDSAERGAGEFILSDGLYIDGEDDAGEFEEEEEDKLEEEESVEYACASIPIPMREARAGSTNGSTCGDRKHLGGGRMASRVPKGGSLSSLVMVGTASMALVRIDLS